MKNPIIETNRFYMRKITMDDVDDMFELDSDPKVHIYLGNNPIRTKAEAKDGIQYIMNQYEKKSIGRFAVIDKANDDFLGWSGLKFETELRKEFDYFDLGYRFKQKHWGRGIATETAIASLKFGFEKLGLKEICGCADVDHGASNKVLKRVGLIPAGTFTYEGVLCNWYTLTAEQYKKL